MTVNVGILNVAGYMGAEVARLLHGHPDVRIAGVTGRSAAGKRLVDVFPHLFAIDLPVTESLQDGVDVVISALPHGAAAQRLVPFIDAGVPVVDLSADFRLRDAAQYESYYNVTHPAARLLEQAVFGMPELHRNEIAGAKLVGVSGCHAAGVMLALAPLFAAGVIEPDVIADTKTGLSGAGRALNINVHFSEADENVAPYALDGHRHLPEMVQELAGLAEQPRPEITFVPHYVPMTRGILSTCYARLKLGALSPDAKTAREGVMRIYRDFYRDAPFTRVSDVPPSTKHVMGTNYCIVHPSVNLQTNLVVVSSAIDNLGKGGAGNGVQCLNVMCGLPETAGLQALGLFP